MFLEDAELGIASGAYVEIGFGEDEGEDEVLDFLGEQEEGVVGVEVRVEDDWGHEIFKRIDSES